MTLLLRTAAIVAVLAAACSPASPAEERVEGVQGFVVTRDDGDGPASCSPAAVGKVMVRFLHAVNTGADPTGSFASDFKWYSMTEGNPKKDGRHWAAYTIDDARNYFTGRASHDESMTLLQLSMSYDPGRDINHLQYFIERTSDDTAEFGNRVTGKGAFNCDEGKILLLSMGMAPDIMEGMADLCPEPEQLAPSIAVVCGKR